MIIDAAIACALLLPLAACSGASSASSPLVRGLEQSPPGVREACTLAAMRCTRCHPIGRLLSARVRTPSHWQRYIARMRLQPASGISTSDAKTIARCLVYRSFGQKGLDQLGAEGGQ